MHSRIINSILGLHPVESNRKPAPLHPSDVATKVSSNIAKISWEKGSKIENHKFMELSTLGKSQKMLLIYFASSA